jgi:hypothetical protein
MGSFCKSYQKSKSKNQNDILKIKNVGIKKTYFFAGVMQIPDV